MLGPVALADRFGRTLVGLIARHEYIPALLPRLPQPRRGRKPKGAAALRFEAGWEPLSPRFADDLAAFAAAMPGVCRAAACAAPKGKAAPTLHEPEALLRHFTGQMLAEVVAATSFTQKTLKAVAGTPVAACLLPHGAESDALHEAAWHAWRIWRDRAAHAGGGHGFVLGLRLCEPAADDEESWALEWLAVSRRDPSLQLALDDYWARDPTRRRALAGDFGDDFQQQLLRQLGQAAQIFPPLWAGLDGDRPTDITLDRDRAFAFLRQDAWVLEAAGYKVIVPSWWTPEGRVRAQLRLRAGSSATAAPAAVGGHFSLPGVIDYRYELAIGGEPVSEAEWQALVAAKTPLVRFRGQWMELDQERMTRMLELWRKQGGAPAELTLPELLQRSAAAEEDGDTLLALDDALDATLARLRENGRLEPLADPPGLNGQLRDYQRRGLSWLHYLESLGLGPCLADDMGLGKTLQVIALLLHERAAGPAPGPTLLIAPTSVLGNWRKELERFAPGLTALLHHGAERERDKKSFADACSAHDVVITSFSLARRDAALLEGVRWQRVAVDEAQNLKNPNAAQTKAILKLPAPRRLALTGTPIENRLLDLWSLFRFLNPGYLGTQAQFRKRFELPIQRDESPARSATLKRLVEPFILRRLKSDPAIAGELPPKVEQKVYCQLSREQASLYQAVVQKVREAVEDSDGIQRQGLILSTLMRLKQICNHPAQFLQDGSEFSEGRSHPVGTRGACSGPAWQ